MALVTMAEARDHLKIDAGDDDLDLLLKVEAASEIVIDYIKRPDHGWTDATAPFLIKAAVLLVLADLYLNRENGGLPDAAVRILHRHRDPALA